MYICTTGNMYNKECVHLINIIGYFLKCSSIMIYDTMSSPTVLGIMIESHSKVANYHLQLEALIDY